MSGTLVTVTTPKRRKSNVVSVEITIGFATTGYNSKLGQTVMRTVGPALETIYVGLNGDKRQKIGFTEGY
jgi:hypothetical protein